MKLAYDEFVVYYYRTGIFFGNRVFFGFVTTFSITEGLKQMKTNLLRRIDKSLSAWPW